MKLQNILTLTATALLCISCATAPYNPHSGSRYGGDSYLSGYNNPNGQQSRPGAQPKGYWDGDGVTGAPKIVISRADQSAFFYKGSKLVGVSPVSTGSPGHTTPAGSFKVTQKSPNHASSLYGVIKDKATGHVIVKDADTRVHKAGAGEVFVNAPMPNFLRFNGAIGMHAGFLPGYPASHGCVRLPSEMSKIFFDNAPHGTPVIVK